MDNAPVVRFDGIDYVVTNPVGSSIEESDLAEIGLAETIGGAVHVADANVHRLEGVDAKRILIMRSSTAIDGPFVMLIAQGVLSGAGGNELFTRVPELCPYFPNQQGCRFPASS